MNGYVIKISGTSMQNNGGEKGALFIYAIVLVEVAAVQESSRTIPSTIELAMFTSLKRVTFTVSLRVFGDIINNYQYYDCRESTESK